ncbi:MAG: hypothetical protein PUG71_03940 [bacterium]|nr:hypothetical protein [bacterium]
MRRHLKKIRFKTKRIRCYYQKCPHCGYTGNFPDSGECPACGETS